MLQMRRAKPRSPFHSAMTYCVLFPGAGVAEFDGVAGAERFAHFR